VTEEMDQPQALALWCANLPLLRQRAAAGQWTDRLDRAAERLRAGGSALLACERFGLLERSAPGPAANGQSRGSDDPPLVLVPGLDPLPLTGRGEYRCPGQRCSRREQRDDHGHPPVCTLFDQQPMVPSV
jgi:hypothetical protein